MIATGNPSIYCTSNLWSWFCVL